MRGNRIFSFLSAVLIVISAVLPVTAREAAFTDGLTFLGDSTTAHMLSRAPLADNTQVIVTRERWLNLDPHTAEAKVLIPGTQEEVPLREAVARLKPARLVVTLGVDYGVYYYRNRPDLFRRCYEKLLDTIALASPQTTVITEAIFPVGRNSKNVTNAMIDRANAEIKALSAERGLVFVDANTPLRDAEGYLAPAYVASEDGIHLTAAAYRVIFDTLNANEARITGGVG